MTRLCACGCGEQLPAAARRDARYLNSSCRATATRARQAPQRGHAAYTHCTGCGRLLRVIVGPEPDQLTGLHCGSCGSSAPLGAVLHAMAANSTQNRSYTLGRAA
jgi:hypothetical protein